MIVFNDIKNIIIESLDSQVSLSLNDRLDEIPGWSSIIYVMVISAIESRFCIQLPANDLFDIEDINGLVDLVLRSY